MALVGPGQTRAVRHDCPSAYRFLPVREVADPCTHSQPLDLGLAHSRHLISTREIDLKSPPRGTEVESMEVEDEVQFTPRALGARGLLGIPRKKEGALGGNKFVKHNVN